MDIDIDSVEFMTSVASSTSDFFVSFKTPIVLVAGIVLAMVLIEWFIYLASGRKLTMEDDE